MYRKQKRIGEILIDKGLITLQQLNDALKEQQKTKEILGRILVKRNYIEEKDLLTALAEQFDMPFVSLKNQYIDRKLLKEFNPSLILDYKCFPLKRDEWSVTVAIINPLDVWAIKKAEEETRGFRLRLVLVSEGDMQEIINRYKQYIKSDISRLFE